MELIWIDFLAETNRGRKTINQNFLQLKPKDIQRVRILKRLKILERKKRKV